MTTINAALLAAALLFVLFIIAQALLPALMRRGGARAASAGVEAALARAKDASRPAEERAAAYREAAGLALDELRRPRLAVRLSQEADALAPAEPATIELVARAMTRARDLRGLERHLWSALDARTGAPAGDPAYDAALDALLALYEGPMKAPERARVLRALSGRTPSATTAPRGR